MEILTLIVIVVSVIFFLKTLENFIYFFIPLNFLLDLISGLYETGGILAYVRATLILVFFAYVILNYTKIKIPKSIALSIYIFLSTLLFLVLFSNNLDRSFTEYSKTLMILLSFIVSYKLFSKGKSVDKLLKLFIWIFVFTLINALISNFYNFGWSGYSSRVQFYSGSIFANVWYTPALAVIVGFELYDKARVNIKKYLILLISATFIIVLLSGRRSAYAIIILGIIFFFLTSEKKSRFLKITFLLIALLMFTFPLYESVLFDQYQARTKRLQRGIEEEGRYVETIDLWDEILSFEDKELSFIGTDPFDTQNKYSTTVVPDRYIHIDLNIIVFSSGIIGLIIYISIYVFIFLNYLKQKKSVNYYLINYERMNLNYIFLAFFISAVLLSFSGGLNAISFRTTIFIVLGAILGHYNYLNIKRNRHAQLSK